MTDTTVENGAPEAGAPADEYAFLQGAEFSEPESTTEPQKEPTEPKESEHVENAPGDEQVTHVETGAETNTDPAEEVVFQYGDEEIASDPTDPPPAETDAERQQRERAEALEEEVRQLKEQNAPVNTELKKPELWEPGIDGDQAKYETALETYYEAKAGQAHAVREQERQHKEALAVDERVFKQNLSTYNQRLTSARVQFPDIERADNALAATLPPQHQAAIIAAGLENPEMVVYALHKRPELREAFAKENNPIRLGVMLAEISKKSRVAPKVKAAQVNQEPQVRGSQGTSPQDPFFKEFPDAEIS